MCSRLFVGIWTANRPQNGRCGPFCVPLKPGTTSVGKLAAHVSLSTTATIAHTTDSAVVTYIHGE
jgi:hypothetical protein